jgi:hypothetical protein
MTISSDRPPNLRNRSNGSSNQGHATISNCCFRRSLNPASNQKILPSVFCPRNGRFAPEADSKAASRLFQTEDGGLSYWTSAIFGPDDSICALVAEGLFDGNVSKILLLRIAAHVLERQHRDRGLVGKNERLTSRDHVFSSPAAYFFGTGFSPLWLGLEPRRKVRPSPRLDFKVDQKS